MINTKIINKSNLYSNLDFCYKKSQRKIMAMVKADAYGHGMSTVVKLLKDKCEWFGVVTEKEAISLRKVLGEAKILNVGKSKNFRLQIENNIDISVDSIEELKEIEKICSFYILSASVHIAVNTGMNRFGVKNVDEFIKMLKFLNKSKFIKLVGVYTHFFDEDETINHFDEQMDYFERFVKYVPNEVNIHIGGSYCLKNNIPNFVNMIRVGFFLYGYGDNHLKPIMQINSKVIKIIECDKGENVGYGKNQLCKKKKVALIPIGYADGLPRRISKIGYVYIGENKCKILAKVCMDCIMVDVTRLMVKVGDRVNLFKSAEDLAFWTKTSTYEILTNFSRARAKHLII